MDEQMKSCSQCGVSMPESSMFCPTCGAKQNESEVAAPVEFFSDAPQPVPQPAAESTAYTPTPVQPVTATPVMSTVPVSPVTPPVYVQPQAFAAQPMPTALPLKPKKKFPWLYLVLTLLMLIGIGVVGYLYFSGNIVDFTDITFADDVFAMLVLGLSGILLLWNISMRLLTAGLKRKTVVDVLQIITFAIVVYLLIEIIIAGPVYGFTTDLINNLFSDTLQHTIN